MIKYQAVYCECHWLRECWDVVALGWAQLSGLRRSFYPSLANLKARSRNNWTEGGENAASGRFIRHTSLVRYIRWGVFVVQIQETICRHLTSCWLSMVSNQSASSDLWPLTSTRHFRPHDCLSLDFFSSCFRDHENGCDVVENPSRSAAVCETLGPPTTMFTTFRVTSFIHSSPSRCWLWTSAGLRWVAALWLAAQLFVNEKSKKVSVWRESHSESKAQMRKSCCLMGLSGIYVEGWKTNKIK